jgi:hypothetical protein
MLGRMETFVDRLSQIRFARAYGGVENIGGPVSGEFRK